ncbi:uncharacterized protein [Cicer arietinum]|uniref:Uncharacterized protein LOC113787743 n=1 Tax=Cicer arietinum TaxID=3827 RepID=A0A3Q7XGN2_CICAR|nr:uncharacterized protein LOC113787743 [Cicer arietinum]
MDLVVQRGLKHNGAWDWGCFNISEKKGSYLSQRACVLIIPIIWQNMKLVPWETRDKKLILYFTYIKELSFEFDKITFHHVPQENNQLADFLATLSSMFQINRNNEFPSIKMESRDHHAYCNVMEEETNGEPWYHDIKHYLKNREYPPEISENEKRTLRRLTASFFVNTNILYKRNHDMVLLRCVDVNEAKEIL